MNLSQFSQFVVVPKLYPKPTMTNYKVLFPLNYNDFYPIIHITLYSSLPSTHRIHNQLVGRNLCIILDKFRFLLYSYCCVSPEKTQYTPIVTSHNFQFKLCGINGHAWVTFDINTMISTDKRITLIILKRTEERNVSHKLYFRGLPCWYLAVPKVVLYKKNVKI